ncbi:hypothetical protein D3C71_376690 [compost metagenome]
MEYDLSEGFEPVADDASKLASVIDACLSTGRMDDMIRRFSDSLGFRQYKPATAIHELAIAEAAVTKFLVTGSEFFAADHIEDTLDKAEEIADLASQIRNADFFDALVKATSAVVRERFPHVSPLRLENLTSERVLDRTIDMVHAADESKPLDMLRGVKFVFCFVPGIDAADSLEETMTSHWSDESSSLTIRPDMVFARFLKLAGVSRDQWLDAVEEVCGVDLREDPAHGAPAWMWERTEAWRRFNPPHEAGQKPITDVRALVEAVDNVPSGFTPSISFSADAQALMSRDWNRPLTVKGGVIGLSDLIHGSGDPLRFDGAVTIAAEREDFVLSANLPNPVEQAYGIHASAFQSQLKDGKGVRLTSDESRWSVFSERDRSVA